MFPSGSGFPKHGNFVKIFVNVCVEVFLVHIFDNVCFDVFIVDIIANVCFEAHC